jgi:membrane-associated HD superfamily phosphohydrolase
LDSIANQDLPRKNEEEANNNNIIYPRSQEISTTTSQTKNEQESVNETKNTRYEASGKSTNKTKEHIKETRTKYNEIRATLQQENQQQQQLGELNRLPSVQQTIPQYDTMPNKINAAWGSSINNLPPTIFRIYFQNINGLQFQTSQSKWQPHLKFMKEKGISISGLAETNTNWYHKNIKKQISNTTQKAFENYSLVISDNQFNPPDRSSYLPGGCLQICTDHWTSRIIEPIKNSRRM